MFGMMGRSLSWKYLAKAIVAHSRGLSYHMRGWDTWKVTTAAGKHKEAPAHRDLSARSETA